MQESLKRIEDSRDGVDFDSAGALHPGTRASKRVVFYLCFLSLWLTVLVAILTLNEWFALIIQRLALSGSLLPLAKKQQVSALSGEPAELSEGYESCSLERAATS